MAEPASQAELNKFVKVVDEFKANYARLILPATRAEVYATQNSAMISDYETAVSRGAMLNTTIENLVGAWNAFKSTYANVTDKTSLVIGDAIDKVRSWFGYDPAAGFGEFIPQGEFKPYDGWAGGYGTPYSQLAGLAAIQIPAAVAIAGIVSAALLLNSMMNKIFVNLQANKIQKANPNLDRGAALEQAQKGLTSFFPTSLSVPMLAAGAFALYLILGNRK